MNKHVATTKERLIAKRQKTALQTEENEPAHGVSCQQKTAALRGKIISIREILSIVFKQRRIWLTAELIVNFRVSLVLLGIVYLLLCNECLAGRRTDAVGLGKNEINPVRNGDRSRSNKMTTMDTDERTH